jgi:ABC-type polysaccharide/polyol phosphate transport system ATPase subunit
MIAIQNICKSYGTRTGRHMVLSGVTFNLVRGERLGILGKNGSGKSTLMRLVSGAERPDVGTISREMSVSWPLAFGGAFHIDLSGKDNVRFISRLYDTNFARNLAFVEDFAELGPYLSEPVRHYSSGMRARLAFAISMIIEFDCFLIDEVGAVGDARFHDRCNHELFVKRSDRAMMITSHDAAYIRDRCNRWGVLHESRLVLFDDFEEAYSLFKRLIGWTPPPDWPATKPPTA